MKYIYDAQIRRILLQITRIFTQFSIPYSVDEDGNVELRRVPARYAGTDTLVQSIITNNTENFIMALPFISVSIKDIKMDRTRTGTTGVYNTERFSTREWDKEKQTYTHNEGNRYQISRYQGFPFELEVDVNIFTSNLTQKLQLFEQICLIFNPAMDFQTSTAPLDMYRLNNLEMTGIKFSDKNFPIDPTKGSYDTMTLSFIAKCYIAPPATVDVQKVVETIVANIGFNVDNPEAYDLSPQTRIENTPYNCKFEVSDLESPDGSNTNQTMLRLVGKPSWKELLKDYGIYESGVSQFRLRCLDWNRDNQFNDDGSKKRDYEVIGTLRIPSIDSPEQEQYSDDIAIWTIDPDSYPLTTMDTIDGIIDPHVQIPQKRDLTNYLNRDEKIQPVDLFNNARYIVLSDMLSNTKAWGKFYDVNGSPLEGIHAGDIIQYRETVGFGRWIRVFDSQASTKNEVVYSSYDNKIYVYTDGAWGDLINGLWQGSRARIICKPFSEEIYN